jgi:creatinine amidohydrolase
VLVNGHGGNRAGVADAVSRITDEGRAVLAWWPRVDDGDAHAGRTETSIMLALAPDAVRLEHARPGYAGAASAAFSPGLRATSPTGIVGDPTGASAEEGCMILDALTDDLVETVRHWRTGGRPA